MRLRRVLDIKYALVKRTTLIQGLYPSDGRHNFYVFFIQKKNAKIKLIWPAKIIVLISREILKSTIVHMANIRKTKQFRNEYVVISRHINTLNCSLSRICLWHTIWQVLSVHKYHQRRPKPLNNTSKSLQFPHVLQEFPDCPYVICTGWKETNILNIFFNVLQNLFILSYTKIYILNKKLIHLKNVFKI